MDVRGKGRIVKYPKAGDGIVRALRHGPAQQIPAALFRIEAVVMNIDHICIGANTVVHALHIRIFAQHATFPILLLSVVTVPRRDIVR